LAQTPAKQSACSSTRTLLPPAPLSARLPVLHVMPDLVPDDVGVRELTWRSELLRHQIEEAQIEIDLSVIGTVEGTHRRLSETT